MSDTNPNTPIYYLTAADLRLKQCLHDISDARKAGLTPDNNYLNLAGFLVWYKRNRSLRKNDVAVKSTKFRDWRKSK
jgi:hypothetical protein